MKLARVLDEASSDLAVVESAVGSARHVLDIAQESERVGGRVAARLRTLLIVAATAAATLGIAYGVKVVLDRRRAASKERVLTYFDEPVPGEPR